MSNKTIFKRIALAVVTALGAGVLTTLSVTGAAATPHGGDVLTVGTPSKTSVVQGDTVSVTVDYAWTTSVAGETATVLLGGDTTDFANAYVVAVSADSANVTNHGIIAGGTAISATAGDSVSATAAGTYTRAKFTINLANFTAPATAKTVTYTVAIRSGGATGPIEQSSNFTLTLNAKDTVGVASRSLVWLNNALTTTGVNAPRADSTLVVAAGSAASPAAVGYIWQEARNASDTTNSTTATSRDVTANFTITITGPGTLDKYVSGTLVGTKVKSLTATAGETVVVYSDGTPGTATITSYIGSTALTQAAKTITFFGMPASITATVDSTTVSSATTANRMISFVVKDSAGNSLSNVGTVYNTGTPGSGFYAVYSDTKVVSGTAAIAGGTAAYTLCNTYSATAAKWYCNLAFNDSGTATVTIVDSLTVGTAVVKSADLTVTASGSAYSGTASFDKATYNIGEKAILTVTAKDSGGRNVADGDHHPWAATVRWSTNAASFTASTGSDAAGGTFTSLLNYLNSGADAVTFVNGVDTAVVFMPTVAGTYTIVGKGAAGTSTTESTVLTFTVVDPAQAANAAAIAAAQAASDAAADAAAEAIDAANAATDAANLAAEAADAATVAAEEARDAADAAAAAVEELATQVATLMAALKAQITTLANTVAKIAKKVRA